MLIHPWDAARDDTEWQRWLAEHDFGQLAVNGGPGEPPLVQPLHFVYDPAAAHVLSHLARPNPVWKALEAAPEVLLSVVDDYAFIPGPWQAPEGAPPEHGVPTSFYAAVQLRCTAHVIDEPRAKAALLQAQMEHFQPEGGSAEVVADAPPYGPKLAGIRVLRLQVNDVRAKFKYADSKPESVRYRIASGLASRCDGRDSGALKVQLSRMPPYQ
ncbi:transcriptional regulator [Streptomyces daqingensis]|uniref:Transcriptional regulator n=1 Tax=Streptomyces daqingensis TaxID=1472640 RepID=A0ABQ2MM98_9ACTN|nr:FMN-binding negative transcriptional regulator [Streptomyces daqingensis]GGO54391.1 transcriptional regulator [Streptomyces daqingensis]